MGNHYIPRAYLKGFTENDSSRFIYCYEKGNRSVIRTNIKNVGQESGFYSEKIEKYLADKIETPIKSVLQSIQNSEQLTMEARQILINFMIVMMVRVPHSKQERIRWLEENIGPHLDELEKELMEIRKSRPYKNEIINKRISEIAKLRIDKKPNPEAIWDTIMSPEYYPSVNWAMQNMTWQFMKREKNTFLTSDNPLFFFRELGLGRKNSELYFPIFPRVALWGTWQNKSLEGYKKATDGFAHEMNRRIVTSATRYVYYSENSESLINFVNKSNHRIKYLITVQAA